MRAKRQAIRAEDFEQTNSPRAHDQPEQSADQGQKNGFSQHLPNDMLAARAHRLADRHFLRAVARADQEEIYQIDRANEQEEKHPACISRRVGRMERT